MSVKVYNASKKGWLSEIRRHIISGTLEAVFLKRKSNGYSFEDYDIAKDWVNKLKKLDKYKSDEWQFYENDNLLNSEETK